MITRAINKVLSFFGLAITMKPPPNWGDDSISDFILNANNNTFASFANKKIEYDRLVRVDSIFHDLNNQILENPEDHEIYPALFPIRTHSFYLAAVRLALSGQIPETFNALRGGMEHALYGYYMLRVTESQSIWEKRGNSRQDKSDAVKEFKIVKLKCELEKESPELKSLFETLYDQCIDFGAHPNEAAVNITLEASKVGNISHIRSSYLHNNPELISLAMLATCRIGLCCLRIFNLMYPDRFDSLKLGEKLDSINKEILYI